MLLRRDGRNPGPTWHLRSYRGCVAAGCFLLPGSLAPLPAPFPFSAPAPASELPIFSLNSTGPRAEQPDTSGFKFQVLGQMYRTTRFGSVQSGSTATITLNYIFKLIGQCTHGFKARNTAIQLNMVFRGLGD